MSEGKLPEKALALWKQAFEKSKDSGYDDAYASKEAFKTLYLSGWSQVEDVWTRDKRASLSEFSFEINRASINPDTGERKWRADTSDTEIDSYGDKMSIPLYKDFLSRIEKMEEPPEGFGSEFWNGGLPYLSLSHYPDINGEGVPGTTTSLFIDGTFLRAKGTLNETPLGIACWDAIKADLKDDADEKVRISIAFLDYKHKHLSEVSKGFIFERKDLEDYCPMCLAEMFTGGDGKEFLEGHLIHLALTRVPANKRTLMEVDRSMTTQLEDAKSIVGEELAEELEDKVKEMSVGKAMLTIKSDAGEQIIEIDIPGLEELKADVSDVLEILRAKKKEKDMEEDEDEEEEETDDEKKKAKKKSGTDESVEEQIVDVDPVLALAESVSKGMNYMSEKLGILIAQNTDNAKKADTVSVPERRGIYAGAPPNPPKPSGTPETVEEYVLRTTPGLR